MKTTSIACLALACAANSLAEPTTELLWGDTHLHTNVSPDAFLFGNRTVTPDDAYRFAKGMPVVNAGSRGRSQLKTPLDFLVVADHAEMMGVPLRISTGDAGLINTEFGADMFSLMKAGKGEQAFLKFLGVLNRGESIEEFEQPQVRQPIWNELTAIADRHNEPGKFTALIGWEWSSLPDGSNLHRVVFTDDDSSVAQQYIPYSSNDSNRPEDLWAWLARTAEQFDTNFVAIPHNANISNGKMFALTDSDGKPITAQYAKTRVQWEPVLEATQIKGDSETIGVLSPDDEFADFESYRHLIKPVMEGDNPEPTEADYMRSALKRGLVLENSVGVNPFKFGVIGSTDSHTGLATAEEDNFAGKMAIGSMPERNRQAMVGSTIRGWDMSASGLAAVWAKDNTRRSIMDAFKRREVYATTGPRISVRLFAGYDFDASDADRLDFDTFGYTKGVPMGADLSAAPVKRSLFGVSKVVAPQLAIRASKDATGANLDRLQVVKGWIDEQGRTHEKIFEAAWSGERRLQEGKLAPIGDTVDRKTGKVSNTIGEPALSVVWQDPEFDPLVRSFYYVRVLQIPTVRHSTLDMLALGVDPESQSDYPVVLQERAYSSPVWYTP